MHKKFEVNRTKIKGGYQLERKAAEMISYSTMPLSVLNLWWWHCILQISENLSLLNFIFRNKVDARMSRKRFYSFGVTILWSFFMCNNDLENIALVWWCYVGISTFSLFPGRFADTFDASCLSIFNHSRLQIPSWPHETRFIRANN